VQADMSSCGPVGGQHHGNCGGAPSAAGFRALASLPVRGERARVVEKPPQDRPKAAARRRLSIMGQGA